MDNEIIMKEQKQYTALNEQVVNKMSGDQLLKLAALGIGGVLTVVGILCLGGYDFYANKEGVSFAKHDEKISSKAV